MGCGAGGDSAGGGAVSAGVLGGCWGGVGLDALFAEELLGSVVGVGVLEDCDGAAEVFDGVEGAAVFKDGDAEGGEVGIEEVGAVDGRAHPFPVEDGCVGATGGEVFGDGAEVGSGAGCAGGEVGLAGVLVFEVVGFVHHALVVKHCGSGEGWVPGEGRDALGGAVPVGELEESALCGRDFLLGEERGREEGEGDAGEESFSHKRCTS